MDGVMRNTIIGAVVGGLAVAGMCFALTGGIMDSMKDNGAATLAAMEAEASSSAADTNTPPAFSSEQGASSETSEAEGGFAGAEGQSGVSDAADGTSSKEEDGISDGVSGGTADGASDGPVDVTDEVQQFGELDGQGEDVSHNGIVRASGDVHIITYGETLSDISAMYGRSVDEFADLNGLHDVNLIYADSALRVPSN